MNKVRYFIILAHACLLFSISFHVRAQEMKQGTPWKGNLADGTIIYQKDLIKLIKERPSMLKGANLSGANLRGANLNRIDLQKTNLSYASLVGANLKEVDLSNATMIRANLREVDLSDAKMIGAIISEADLSRANLTLADLTNAQLGGTDLRDAILINAKMHHASLVDAKLSKAILVDADLSDAIMTEANLYDAELGGANLSGANLRRVDLRKADLKNSILNNADISSARLAESNFSPAEVAGLIFLGAEGLSEMNLQPTPAVIEMLSAAKSSMLRSEERALTSALIKYRIKPSPYERFFQKYVLLGWLNDYGAQPSSCLLALLWLLILFSFPYKIALKKGPKDGIFKVWLPNRSRKDLGSDKHIRMDMVGFRAFGFAFYFSLLSTFSIGWRELNVGNWIMRLQSREYIFRATGWVRTLVGIQSLISLYLFALWVLTYFGRPFE